MFSIAMSREIGGIPSGCDIAGIVLASGMSQRFGTDNKLLASFAGSTVVARTLHAYLEARLDPVFVVVGYQARQVISALADLPVIPLYNPDFSEGQSRSLLRGVHALPDYTRAAVIGVADQPMLTGGIIRDLVRAYRASSPALVVPRYDGRRGNPVLFDRRLFTELTAIEGDQGGRPVLEKHREEIAWVDVAAVQQGADIDTPSDLEALRDVKGSSSN